MTLDFYRKQIDFLDSWIIDLLVKRFEVVKLVWEYKKENNLPPLQPERWKQVLESKIKLWEEKWLSKEFIENIWNEIHKYALSLEK